MQLFSSGSWRSWIQPDRSLIPSRMEATPAILVRKMPWSETSLIVTWLTERFGTVRTVARGARRPKSEFAGMLDLFYGADIALSFSRKGDLHTLREVSVRSVFNVSNAGSAGYYLASYFGELAGMAAPSMQAAPEIFNLLQRGLNFVQQSAASLKALNHFESELCRILGVYDTRGNVAAIDALASLCGVIPASRAAALRFLGHADDRLSSANSL
jgi:DNA repair protein RecO (recombination protein O)